MTIHFTGTCIINIRNFKHILIISFIIGVVRAHLIGHQPISNGDKRFLNALLQRYQLKDFHENVPGDDFVPEVTKNENITHNTGPHLLQNTIEHDSFISNDNNERRNSDKRNFIATFVCQHNQIINSSMMPIDFNYNNYEIKDLFVNYTFDENSNDNETTVDQNACTNCTSLKSTSGRDDFNLAKVYGYGTLVVAIVSAFSALGFVIIPRLPSNVYDIAMTSFMALAFGTLTGDALLHLLPEALSLNDNNNDDDDDTDEPHVDEYFWKCMAIMSSIYLLFFFEGFAELLFGQESVGELIQNHGHSHSHNHEFVQQQTLKEKRIEHLQGSGNTKTVEHYIVEEGRLSFASNQMRRVTVFFGLTTLSYVIIVGNIIHNTTDGMAIGAAFAHNMKSGVSTAIAVWFHELPHEFGDFIILLSTGMSLKMALFWNFITSLTAFAGLYIGISVGQDQRANQWIFAITIGIFLYVAIGKMLPEMKIIKTPNKKMAFLAQNISVLLGMGFMVFIYFLEEMIHM